MVSCGVSWSEVGLSEIRKPQVISERLHFSGMRRGLNAAKSGPSLPALTQEFTPSMAMVTEGLNRDRIEPPRQLNV